MFVNRKGRAAHTVGVAVHDLERCAYVGRQIDFIDDQKVTLHNAGAAFARDLIALGHIDNKHCGIGELGGERGGKVIAATLHKDDLDIGVALYKSLDGLEVHTCVLANGGVRAAAGLHAHDTVGGKHRVLGQKLCVLVCVDVVGDDADRVLARHLAHEGLNQCGFARPYGTGDSDANVRHVVSFPMAD